MNLPSKAISGAWQVTGEQAGFGTQRLWNPPGQRALSFRLGSQAEFVAELKRRLLAGLPHDAITAPLAGWDSGADWVAALLGSWAMVGDVLSFYQERYANEGYLRTAQQADSLRYLLDACGPLRAGPAASADPKGGAIYSVDPGAAAVVDLALTIGRGQVTPPGATLGVGMTVNFHDIVRGNIEPFGTLEMVNLSAAWNAMALQPPLSEECIDLPAGATALLLTGQITLPPGTELLLLARDGAWRMISVVGCSRYEDGGKTLVSWTSSDGPALSGVQVQQMSGPLAPFGADALPFDQVSSLVRLGAIRSGGVLVREGAPAAWSALNDGFPDAVVRDMIANADGCIYLATAKGVFVRRPGDGAAFVAMNQGLSSRDVYSLATDSQGMVYVSGGSGMVARSQGPDASWGLLEGNRSMVPRAGQTKAVYTALPLSVVTRVRVSKGPAVYVQTAEGISVNDLTGDGWRLVNPPGDSATTAETKPTGAAIADFVVSDDGDPILMVAEDGTVATYSPTAPTLATRVLARIKRWLARRTTSSLPALGTRITLPSKPLALALCTTPAGHPLLVAGCAAGVFAYSGTRGNFVGLTESGPIGPVLSLTSVPYGWSGDGLPEGSLLVIAAFADGLYGFFAQNKIGESGTGESGLPTGKWESLLAFGTTPVVKVTSKGASAAGGTLHALTPPISATEWPGFALSDKGIDLTALSPQIAPGMPIVIREADSPGQATLRVADSSQTTTLAGFGLSTRPVQSVTFSDHPTATVAPLAPSALSRRTARLHASRRSLPPARPMAVTAQLATGTNLTLAGCFPGLVPGRRMIISGRVPQCLIVPPAGLLAFDTPGTLPNALMTGAYVAAIASNAAGLVVAGLRQTSATAQGGVALSCDSGRTWTLKCLGLPTAGFSVTAVAVSVDGIAMAAGLAGLFVITLGAAALGAAAWQPAIGLPTGLEVTVLLTRRAGGFVAATTAAGLWTAGPTGLDWSRLPVLGWNGKGITALTENAAGTLLAVAPEGLYAVPAMGGSPQVLATAPDTDRLVSLAYDAEAGMAVAGTTNGAILAAREPLRRSAWREVGRSDGVAVTALAVASTSATAAIWVAGGAGWLACSTNRGETWNRLPTPQANVVTAITALRASRILAGCRASVVARIDGHTIPHLLEFEPVASLADAEAATLDQNLLSDSALQALKRQSLDLPDAIGVQTITPGSVWALAALPARLPSDGEVLAKRMVGSVPPSGADSQAAPKAWLLTRDPAGVVPGIVAYRQATSTRLSATPIPAATTAGIDLTRCRLTAGGLGEVELTIAAGSLVPLAPTPKDPVASESATISRAEVDWAGGTTRLDLSAPLAAGLEAASLRISANVVRCGQGKPIADLPIGNGNSSQANQSFAIPMAPLIFDKGEAPGERKSTLSITVNGEEWRQVALLHGQSAGARVYQLQLGANGTARVAFGNGREGARLPTGFNNVRASFRSGAHSSGAWVNASASSSDLATALAGGSTVPAKAIGLQPHDCATSLPVLPSVPNSVQPVGVAVQTSASVLPPPPNQATGYQGGGWRRLVATADYQAFANAFPGVSHAVAMSFAPKAGRPFIGLAVAFEDGTATAPDAKVAEALLGAIRGRQAFPPLPLRLTAVRPVHVAVALRVWGSATEVAVKAVLAERFGWRRQVPGAALLAADVVATVQALVGVEGLVLAALYRKGQTVSLHESLTPAVFGWGKTGKDLDGPEWLLLDAVDVEVDVLGG
jgi:hypothetical protein